MQRGLCIDEVKNFTRSAYNLNLSFESFKRSLPRQ